MSIEEAVIFNAVLGKGWKNFFERNGKIEIPHSLCSI